MTDDATELVERLAAAGQEHLLAFWDELSPAARASLAEQIRGVDFERVGRLFAAGGDDVDWAELARRSAPARAIRLGAAEERPAPADVRRRGAEVLAAGKVGAVLVAGGQGTRLGYDHPKGMFPVGPVSGRSLFQIHLEKILGTARRYATRVPLYLMTSPATHRETIRYLDQHDRFGLAEEDLFVFCQGSMPALDAATGKVLLADKGRLALSPDGHGGALAALEKSGALADAESRGLEQLFYFQVDNPLVPVCDPALIGYHALCDSELSIVVVAKQSPMDRCGNAVSIDGRLRIIEYSDLPREAAEQREKDGSLRIWAGSIAIHVFDVAFLRRMSASDEAMPFHIAHKKVPYVDPATGERTRPAEPNAQKFERFIFDLLPHAAGGMAVECAREDVFSPLKNAAGADEAALEHVQRDMVALHRRWLETAGANVAGGVQVEISGRFALDAQHCADKIPPGTPIDQDQYFV